MDLKLNNLKALVTGSSRGLGYATAKTLLMEGAYVTINSRSKDNLTKAVTTLKEISNEKIFMTEGDVLTPGATERFIEEAVDQMGGLDILITNAGGPPAGSFESFDEETWQRSVDLSFLSHVRLIKAALPHLRKSKHASVLTITSYSVKQPIPNLILSNSIRAATVGLTKSLALELGGDGIRFNSILPAWTETERVYELMSHRASLSGRSVEEEIKLQSQSIPIGRMATPEEFANAATFLVSPAASYITGVMLSVDGGMYKGVL
jgi:3-oxoacyl-[acyl-carrier protein] reductase